ncbi:hypothetical protein R1flu_025047 [Riccia fluitans]|uniref:FAF domain-containing protein n=1 Tax=Riccia fluitans TaxID=41844 RepID=A0ABD1XWM5_9MARC
MKSAYPSSQSFFDASSDSICSTDVEKCRTSSSFSSLSDLFGRNSSGNRSELISNVRTPVFAPAEVTFPSRKNRPECEDHRVAGKVSLWHEWGSGECPGEESSGLLSDKFKSQSSELFRASSSNLFPNLGTANVCIVPEEFTFPERRKRADESWREQRGFRRDWAPTVENNVRESTAMADSFGQKLADETSRSKPPSDFIGSQRGEFPERRKRNENSFWKDYSSCGVSVPTGSVDCTTSASGSASRVNSLSEFYSKSPTCKCSSLFSSNIGTTNVNSEEVVFPSRKTNPDRNAWRDWSNTGYADWAEDEDSEGEAKEGHASRTFGRSSPTTSYREKSSYFPRVPSTLAEQSSGPADAIVNSSGLQQAGLECRAEEGGAEKIQLEKASGEEYREKVATQEANEDFYLQGSYNRSNSRRDLHDQRSSRQKLHDFPPPLGFLGRQGSLRVPHHLPWVQLQPVRSEGRFILQEVKVNQPVVFEPIREQGRLVLQLIRQDDVCEEKDTRSGDQQPLEAVGGKHAAMADDELDATDRELVKDKMKKANKCPKIHPEPCLPPPNEASHVTSKQAGDHLQTASRVEQNPGIWQESTKEGSVSKPDQGLQNWTLVENQSAPPSEEGKEILALFLRESGLSRQESPVSNASPMKLREKDSHGLDKSGSYCNSRNETLKESSLLHQQILPQSPSIRSFALSETGRAEGEKDDESSERWRSREYIDPRPPFLFSSQAFDGGLSLKATPHFLQWSLKTRTEVLGDSDVRLVNYTPIAASFLCADGVGKRHHEKSFWEQPCVS